MSDSIDRAAASSVQMRRPRVPAFRHTARWFRARALVIGFYAAVLLAWELICRAGLVPAYLLPAPSAIVGRMIEDWELLLRHSMVTLVEILAGFVVGSALGFLLALGIVYSTTLRKLIYPFVLMTQVVPKLAIAPLFIIWLGYGILPKIAITALICLFPVLVNSVTGMTSVDPRLIDLMHSVGASRRQVFRMIRLPNAAPSIFAGLEVAITLAVVGALVGEWVGSSEGLGYLMLIANSQLDTDQLFAALVAISLIGLALYFAMVAIGRVALPHRPESARMEQGL